MFEAEGISKRFGGIQAVDGVSFEVDKGEIVGIIGPNGAGKTTLLKCLSGFTEISSGKVTFRGEDLTGLEPYEFAQKGIVRTFQQSRELTTLTTRENLLVATKDHPGESLVRGMFQDSSSIQYEEDMVSKAERLLESFNLLSLADEYSYGLSGGQRKLLEIARGLMLDPELLLLDEPLAGVSNEKIDPFIDHIRNLNEEGMSFIIIEHDIESLSRLVDRLIVLRDGAILFDDETKLVLEEPEVADAFLEG
jgi:branched-chain amino acid transport system ATP-binding protein